MKLNIIKTVLTIIICVGFASCKCSYYQVYEVDTDNLKTQDNSLVYENEDCKVLYNLWSNNGELKFAILNKTDKDLFVNMGQSFYVVNGQAVDYYQERTFTSQSFVQTSYMVTSARGTSNLNGIWGNDTYTENIQALLNANSGKTVKATSSSVTTKEREIVCIPAKCYKIFNYYKVNPAWIKTCDSQKDYPSKSSKIGSYTQGTTPLTFKNRIAYSFNKNEVADKHIDNTFWITSVTNYSKNEAVDKYKSKSECYGVTSSSKGKAFKIGSPSKFYQPYAKMREGFGRYD